MQNLFLLRTQSSCSELYGELILIELGIVNISSAPLALGQGSCCARPLFAWILDGKLNGYT